MAKYIWEKLKRGSNLVMIKYFIFESTNKNQQNGIHGK